MSTSPYTVPRYLRDYEFAPAEAPEDLRWQDAALCTQVDPEIFFLEKGGSIREAKSVCRNCEVRAECLDFALENDERFGVWGGKSERERRRLKREQAAAGPPLCAKKLHVMDAENTYTYSGPGGTEKSCRACRRVAEAKRRQEAKHDREALNLAGTTQQHRKAA